MTLQLLQRTPEWHRDRLSKVTGSRVADVVCPLKSGKGWRMERTHYRFEKVCERLSGIPFPQAHVSADMLRGIAMEPEARTDYALFYANGQKVTEVGFCQHPTIEMSGASPDGLVGDYGLVEFKAPRIGNHMLTCKTDEVDEDYLKQIHWQFACLPERRWADYVSYHPDAPPEMQVKVIRVRRDDDLVAMLEKEVVIFLKEVDDEVTFFRNKYKIAA